MAPTAANASGHSNQTLLEIASTVGSILSSSGSQGLCGLSGHAYGNGTTPPSSNAPWVLQYLTALAMFPLILIMCSTLCCWNYACSTASCRNPFSCLPKIKWVSLWAVTKDFFKRTLNYASSKGEEIAVFFLSLTSLILNYIVPYFVWGKDPKLSHGWCTIKISSTEWILLGLDLLNNICLLLLFVRKRKKVKRQWRTVDRATETHNQKQQSHSSYRRAMISRTLKDWECCATVANLPLLLFEVLCFLNVFDIEWLFAHWRVRVTSLQFMRIFCFTWLCDEIIRESAIFLIQVWTVIRRIVWIACFFISFAAWIQLVETLGDPYPFATSYNGQKDLSYWKVVTFLYGKLVFLDVSSVQIETTTATISVYVTQAITLIFLLQIIPDMFKKLPEILRIRAFPKLYSRGDKGFVLVLGSITADAVHRFICTFRSTNPGVDIVILLEPKTSEKLLEKMHTVAGKHKDILTVLTASVFEKEDIQNNISRNCKCAFFFANEKARSFVDEDHCNFLRVHSLKQYHPDIRVIVQVLLFDNKVRFYDIPNWNMHDNYDDTGAFVAQADRAICTTEIQFALLGQHYFAPGISRIVNNWFNIKDHTKQGVTVRAVTIENISHRVSNTETAQQSAAVTSNTDNSVPPRNAAVNGTGSLAADNYPATVEIVDEIPEIVGNSSSSSNMAEREPAIHSVQSSGEVSRPVLQQTENPQQDHLENTESSNENNTSEADPFLSPSSSSSHGRIVQPTSEQNGATSAGLQPIALQPVLENIVDTITYEGARKTFHDYGTLFAVLQNGEFHIFPSGNLLLKKGVKLFFLTKLKRDPPQRGLIWSNTNRHTVLQHSKRKPLKIESRAQSLDQNSDETCDITGQYQRHVSYKRDSTLIKLPSEMEAMPKLEHHVVICVLSDRNPTAIGLVNFIKPLRAAPLCLDRPAIVILARADFLETELENLAEFPSVYFIKGDPMQDNHLRAVNIVACRMCVVLDASERPKEQLEKWEQQLLSKSGYWPVLPPHFYRHVNAVLATVFIARFLENNRRQDLAEEILTCIHNEATELISWDQKKKANSKKPCVTAVSVEPSFVDALMLRCYEDKDILDLLQLFVLGGYQEGSEFADDQSIHGCPFVGNQAKISKMSLTFSSTEQGVLHPIWPRKNGCTAQQSGDSNNLNECRNCNTIPGETGRLLTAQDKYNALRGFAAASGLLVIDRDLKPTDNDHLLPSYDCYVLERPLYVKEREILTDAMIKGLGMTRYNLPDDTACAVEYVPLYILRTVEEGSSGLPYCLQTYQLKWLFPYYRIACEFFTDQKQRENVQGAVSRLLNNYLYTDMNAVDNSTTPNGELLARSVPRLPRPILEYVRRVYMDNPESTPLDKLFFHDIQHTTMPPNPSSPIESLIVHWNDFIGKDWYRLCYPPATESEHN